MSEFLIVQCREGIGFYGGVKKVFECNDNEVILAGPADTGKTFGALHKLDYLSWIYPGLKSLIIRKTQKSARLSCVATYQEKVLGQLHEGQWRPDMTPVKKYGGSKPEFFIYPNGSKIYVGGMDNSDKVLSTEYDVIYVNQAEELTLSDWEMLTSRCSGRASDTPFHQIMGDCNPGPPNHWILARAKEGRLTLIENRHEDNPEIFDPETGEITVSGKERMSVLDNLTGIRKERLRYGRWVQAEGAVYEYDSTIHLLDNLDDITIRYYVASVDWGYTEPGCIQVWGVDNDKRLYLVAEIYRVEKVINWWVKRAADLDKEFRIERWLCDPAEPGFIKQFRNAGLKKVYKANNDIALGIQKVENRLNKAGDGKSRIFFLRDALQEIDPKLKKARKPLCTIDEFPVFVREQDISGNFKEKPVDQNNHGMDAMRYCVLEFDARTKARTIKVFY